MFAILPLLGLFTLAKGACDGSTVVDIVVPLHYVLDVETSTNVKLTLRSHLPYSFIFLFFLFDHFVFNLSYLLIFMQGILNFRCSDEYVTRHDGKCVRYDYEIEPILTYQFDYDEASFAVEHHDADHSAEATGATDVQILRGGVNLDGYDEECVNMLCSDEVTEKGFHVRIFDENILYHSGVYDIQEASAADLALADVLAAQPDGLYVAIVCIEDCTRMNNELWDEMYALGAVNDLRYTDDYVGWSYIFVGQFGSTKIYESTSASNLIYEASVGGIDVSLQSEGGEGATGFLRLTADLEVGVVCQSFHGNYADFSGQGGFKMNYREEYPQPQSTFSVEFSFQVFVEHEIDTEWPTSLGDAASSGQNFAFGADRDGINSTEFTDAGLGISVGTNGISVYASAPDYIGSPSILTYEGAIASDRWHHAVVTVTDNLPSLYLNGVLVRKGILPAFEDDFDIIPLPKRLVTLIMTLIIGFKADWMKSLFMTLL